MPELLVLVGLPGSGKTTYAKSLIDHFDWWRRINWDEERVARGQIISFNRAAEIRMQADLFGQAEHWSREGFNVVVDNTNLSERTRNKWKGVAQRAGMTYVENWMEATLDECVARDSRREGRAQVGRAVIERMALFAGLCAF